MRKRYGAWTLALAGVAVLGGCDDDVMAPSQERMFEVQIENVSASYDFPSSGRFDTPAGAESPGPVMPGGTYELSFSAPPGARLSFATMMAQSNDMFYAPDGDGIALWTADGSQVTGDVTDQVLLWDAGTEIDQEPGLGPDQVIRQSGPDTGADDPDPTVRPVTNDFGTIPPVEDVLRLTLMSTGPYSWTARIQNVGTATILMASDGSMHAIPLSPGVFVVHTAADPLFTNGQPDRGQGLEAIAEDGAAGDLADVLPDRTGVTGMLSPGVYAVHRVPSVLFAAGRPDAGLGLESIAEDGSPSALAGNLVGSASVTDAGAFDTPEGASGPGPLTPGGAYTFTITAEPGDRLSFATMFGQSNDLFYAPAEAGIDLFPGGVALSGNVTGMLLLWDAGTEVNEKPGVGPNQAPRQAVADTGPAENGNVRQVDDGYQYGSVDSRVRVTITPAG